MEKKEILEKAIQTYRPISQIEMLMEESIELSLAVRKFLRSRKGNDEESIIRLSDVFSEIADVEIMIEQFKMMFPTAEKGIESFKTSKLNRLENRLKNGKNN